MLRRGVKVRTINLFTLNNTMKETIYYLEGRGGMYLFHFFIYNLGGLFYIVNKNYDIKYSDSVKLTDKSRIVNEPTIEISYPIKIYIKDVLPFQRDAFNIISDKFHLIETLPDDQEYEIISIYGETCKNRVIDHPETIAPFIRKLFTDKLPYDIIKGKRIFITRKNSESQHQCVLKRYIKNESDLMKTLSKYNFEFIQLEDYKTHDKIKLFMESETILSSHSGALTFCLFANINAKIIEILNKGTSGCDHEHYNILCRTLKLNYNRYTSIIEDNNGNFNLDIDSFEKYIKDIM